jgi:transcription elongation factor Elf1
MATRTKRSLDLVCPLCGARDESLTIELNSLGTIACGSCSEEFSVEEAIARVTAQLEAWRACGTWISLAPISEK